MPNYDDRNCSFKIHRVKVTAADLNYIGSITIDQICSMQPIWFRVKSSGGQYSERRTFWDLHHSGARGSGEISVNGPAARKVQPGDVVIVMSYGLFEFEEAKKFKPSIIFPNEETNRLDG